MLLATHLIYSIIFSVYAVFMFKDLCVPELNATDTKVNCSFNVNKNDTGVSTHLEKIVCVQIAWVLLVIFTIVYLLKEFTKLWHLGPRKYLW